jgi:N-methylhydantoinase B/oxoprolinase/acetone carboxylase alpha subunit
MYPPNERDVALVTRDVADGIVTPEAAQRDYGTELRDAAD